MNYSFRKNIKLLMAATAISSCATFLFSCSKSDEYKKYQEGGELMYTGKLDSVKINPGNNRVQLTGMLKADPKIKKMTIFWNDRRDSISFDVDLAANGRAFSKTFPVEEGIRNFVIYTYDTNGNRSVAVNKIGTIYGPRYASSITNRLVGTAASENGKTTINWLPADTSAGTYATEVRYTSLTGLKTIRVPALTDKTVLDAANPAAATFSYRTLYLPKKNSIDTFYTAFAQVGIFREVTEQFLSNTKIPFTTSVRGDRWGIPTGWITNAAVRNFRQSDGVFYGGVDGWGEHMAMEAGWSTDNMGSIVNGKIYQSPVLPAGQYTFEMDIPACTPDGDFYTVAAEGDEIPNTGNINASLAYIKSNNAGTYKISFTLAAAKKVSIGFVGNVANKGGGDGTYWRISGVRLRQLAPLN